MGRKVCSFSRPGMWKMSSTMHPLAFQAVMCWRISPTLTAKNWASTLLVVHSESPKKEILLGNSTNPTNTAVTRWQSVTRPFKLDLGVLLSLESLAFPENKLVSFIPR